MHVVNFKKFPNFLRRRKTLLRLLSGKGRGFILHKTRTNQSLLSSYKLIQHRDRHIYVPNFSRKRKKKNIRIASRLKFQYPVLSKKRSPFSYHFKSAPLHVKDLSNLQVKPTQSTSKVGLNRVYWKLYSTNKRSQQSRTLSLYNDMNASSSFFNKRY